MSPFNKTTQRKQPQILTGNYMKATKTSKMKTNISQTVCKPRTPLASAINKSVLTNKTVNKSNRTSAVKANMHKYTKSPILGSSCTTATGSTVLLSQYKKQFFNAYNQ
jgi:hypothetical protein